MSKFTVNKIPNIKLMNCLYFKKNPSNNYSGFTLIEIMLILAILGIILMITLPHFDTNLIKKLQIQRDARQLQADLILTRSLAITNRVNCNLQIYPNTHDYKIFKNCIQFGETKTINPNIAFSGDTNFIFENMGNLNTDSGTNLTLTLNSNQAVISINIVTGKVDLN